jgi:hypothetical protein
MESKHQYFFLGTLGSVCKERSGISKTSKNEGAQAKMFDKQYPDPDLKN